MRKIQGHKVDGEAVSCWQLSRRERLKVLFTGKVWLSVWTYEDRITPHILRHWDRDRIVRFAKHLLGDTCQACPKHNKAISEVGD